MKKLLNEIFYPSGIKCIVCDAELPRITRYELCDCCAQKRNLQFCMLCGRPLGGIGQFCEDCMREKHGFDEARSAFEFTGDIRELVYRFKYGNARYLALPMAQFLADVLYESGWEADSITFVPLHKKRERTRGYNQSRLLAEELSAVTQLPCAELLQKTTFTKNMARLGRRQRADLIAGTFLPCSDADWKGKKIILVDDVLTTGATAGECARMLKKAGCSTVYVLTFASVRIKSLLVYAEKSGKKVDKTML